MARDSFTVRGIIRTQYEGSNEISDAAEDSTRLGTAWGKLAARATLLVGSLTAVTSAFSSLIRGAQEAANAAAQTEQSYQRLANNTKLLGDTTGETAKALSDQADSLQSLTGVSADVIRESQGLLAALGVQTDQLEEATQASLDLSAALGISLESAARNVGRTVGGFAGELGEVIPELKDFTAEALQAGEGIKFLGEQFAGSAAENAETYAARLAKISAEFEEVNKALGQATIESKNVAVAQDLLAKQTANLSENVQFVSAAYARLNAGIATAKLGLVTLGAIVGRQIDSWLGYKDAVEETAEATDKLNKAQKQQADLLPEVEAKLKALVKSEEDLLEIRKAEAELLERLGIKTQQQLADALEKTRIEQELLDELLNDGLITQTQYADGQKQLAEQTAELEAEMNDERVAADALTTSLETLETATTNEAQAQVTLTNNTEAATRSLQRQATQLAFTAAQFDNLARSAGTAAAVEAAVAAGGETILGGTRVLLPGGGSRLVRPPGFTSVNNTDRRNVQR